MATAICSALGMACSFHVAWSETCSDSVKMHTGSPLLLGCRAGQHITSLPERSKPTNDALRGNKLACFTGGHCIHRRYGLHPSHRRSDRPNRPYALTGSIASSSSARLPCAAGRFGELLHHLVEA